MEQARLQEIRPQSPMEEKTAKTVAAGSSIGAIGGIGAVVLSILGLAGVIPSILLAISVIAVGAALLSEGAAIALRYSQIAQLQNTQDPMGKLTLLGGTSAEAIAGCAGIALGILALVGINPLILTSCALIAFGAGMLLGSGETAEFGNFSSFSVSRSDQTAQKVVQSAAGAQALVGLSAVALGILALLGINALVLAQVGMLAVGASLLHQFSHWRKAGNLISILNEMGNEGIRALF